MQVQGQFVAAQAQAIQTQAIGLPVGHQLQLLELVVAIEQEAADAYLADLQRQGQAQFRQADGALRLIGR
ncbi:hypothetical protein D3C78_1565250 [compost metagenome]